MALLMRLMRSTVFIAFVKWAAPKVWAKIKQRRELKRGQP